MRILIYLIFGLLLYGCSFSQKTKDNSEIHNDTSALGVEWKQTSGPVFWMEDLAFVGTQNSIVSIDTHIFVGSGIGVFISKDKGKSWSLTNHGLKNTEVMCLAAMENNLLAGTWGNQGGIYLSVDKGNNWKPVFIRNDNTYIHNLSVVGKTVYAEISGNSSEDDGLYFSTDFGKSWSKIQSTYSTFTSKTLVTDGTNLYVGKFGGLYMSLDHGHSWNNIDSGFFSKTGIIKSLVFVGTKLFAGTDAGVFISFDKGVNWKEANVGLEDCEVKTLIVSGSYLFAGTSKGVFISENDGANWTEMNNGLKNRNIDVMAVVYNSLLIGNSEGICRSTDMGANWETVNQGLANTYVYALTLDKNQLYAGTNAGLFLSTDKGLSWTKVDTFYNDAVTSIAIVDKQVIAGTEFGVMRYTKNGPVLNQLTESKGVGMNNLTRCLAVVGNDVFAGTFGSGIFVSHNQGKSWKALKYGLSDSVINSLAVDGNNILAGTEGGIYLTQDLGEHWTMLISNSKMKKVFKMPCVTDYTVNAYAIAISGKNLFIGTRGCGVFHSPDYGETWTVVNEGLENKVVQALSIKGNNLFAITEAGIFVTNNHGVKWRSINKGLELKKFIYSFAISDFELYAGTNGQGVFISTYND